jgi:hypothetical protein
MCNSSRQEMIYLLLNGPKDTIHYNVAGVGKILINLDFLKPQILEGPAIRYR